MKEISRKKKGCVNEWMEGRKRMEKNGDKDGNVSNSRVVGGLAKERRSMAMGMEKCELGAKGKGGAGPLALTAPICFGLSTAFSGERHTHTHTTVGGVVATAMIHENCESALLALSMSVIVQFGSLAVVPMPCFPLAAYDVESAVKD